MDEPNDGEPKMRDLFAGFALIGVIMKYGTGGKDYSEVAALAYQLADAMMEERAE